MNVQENNSIIESTCDDFDDLFGFEAARKREEKRALIEGNDMLRFTPWRVFINHIDSYHGKLLTDVRARISNILGSKRIHIHFSVQNCSRSEGKALRDACGTKIVKAQVIKKRHIR